MRVDYDVSKLAKLSEQEHIALSEALNRPIDDANKLKRLNWKELTRKRSLRILA